MHSDSRIAEAVRFGFEREGTQVVCLTRAGTIASALAGAERSGLQVRPDLVIAGAGATAAAMDLIAAVREELDAAGMHPPILCTGSDLDRQQVLDAGANEVVLQPAFVRDVVAVGRFLVAARRGRGGNTEGQLSDYGGVFYIIRAMAATRRSAVLSLVRGLRRGELRFYRGEVTSAQVSVLHGLAALHQLLLWTRAHFELRDENVVRRRQIPLESGEILDDAERFLGDIRAVAGTLLPLGVYEVDRELMQERRSTIPRPVRRVLRLIDGHRTMSDVIEDSPYRVLETLRIANRLVETGLVRCKPAKRAQEDVSIERWLADQYAELSSVSIGSMELEPVGGWMARAPFADEDEDIGEEQMTPRPELRPATPSSSSPSLSSSSGSSVSSPAPSGDDWSDVLPTELVTGFSPVVPSTSAAGEIVSAVMPGPPAGDGVDDQVQRGDGDAPASADLNLDAAAAGRPSSLWKRLFSKGRPDDD